MHQQPPRLSIVAREVAELRVRSPHRIAAPDDGAATAPGVASIDPSHPVRDRRIAVLLARIRHHGANALSGG
jgi:hypothetical protein